MVSGRVVSVIVTAFSLACPQVCRQLADQRLEPAWRGWLDAADAEAVYAPHTYKGFVAPPRKNLLLVSNGLIAKYGSWQARRQGRAGQLEELARGRARPGQG